MKLQKVFNFCFVFFFAQINWKLKQTSPRRDPVTLTINNSVFSCLRGQTLQI